MELEYEESAADMPGRREGQSFLAATGSASTVAGGAYGMTVTTSTQTVRLGWTGAAGLCVGVVFTWRTGLLAALPSTAGLTVLAVTDMTSRRIPKDVFAVAAIGTAICGILDSLHESSTHRLAVALFTSAILGVIAGAVWFATSGIAFGDVKLLALAAFVPAWLRCTAVISTVLVTLLAAVAMVLFERLRAGSLSMKSTIAFGPPLVVGWLVGVWTA